MPHGRDDVLFYSVCICSCPCGDSVDGFVGSIVCKHQVLEEFEELWKCFLDGVLLVVFVKIF